MKTTKQITPNQTRRSGVVASVCLFAYRWKQSSNHVFAGTLPIDWEGAGL